jgi:uncharacterized membrane protein YphA (DoxX/SURF4 family)
MLVVLRLALGWHFLYEGVWKLTHRDAFLAETEGFLSSARGPAARFFNRMVWDIDGTERLERDLGLAAGSESKAAEGEPKMVPLLAAHWWDITKEFVAYYRPSHDKDALYRDFDDAAKMVCRRHIEGLQEFVKENGDKIKAHFDSFRRFNEQLKTDPSTDFMRQRRVDQLQEYRKEAKGWIAELEAREKALKAELLDLLSKERHKEVWDADQAAIKESKEKAAKNTVTAKKASNADDMQPAKSTANGNDGKAADPAKLKSLAEDKPSDEPRGTSAAPAKAEVEMLVDAAAVFASDFSALAEGHDPAGPFRESRNPLHWSRTEQLSTLLSYGLTAIGLCLLLGLFTRLSALAGAAFMLTVVLCQPSYPGVYPPDLPQMGHALLVNKDFVEMIALLVIASTSLGRWTGMDFFLHHCIIRPLGHCCCCCCRRKGKGDKA